MTDEISAIRAHAELFDIPGQAVIATTLDGTIVYWGSAAARLYGWSEQEAVGQNVVEVTPAAMSREEAGAILSELRAGRSWSGEFDVRKRDGQEFRAYVRDVPVRAANGQVVGIVGVSRPARER
jgi:PAS domain S-box-containing protein